MRKFPTTTQAIIAVLCLYPSYLVWKLFRYQLAMRKAGCSTPIRYPHKDPILGLDLFWKFLNATKSGDSKAVERQIFAYGKTVQTNSRGRKKYFTMDAQNMQVVLTTHAEKFGPSPRRHVIGAPFLGDGIFTAREGEIWKKTRQLITPVFARAQVSELSTLKCHVQRLIGHIPRDSSTIDLQPLLRKLYLDSSTEFIFGHSTNSLAPEIGNLADRQLPELFDDCLRGLFERAMLGRFRWISRAGMSDKIWLDKCQRLHTIVDSYIDEEIRYQRENKAGIDDDRFPYKYVLLKELAKRSDDKAFIRSQLLNVFLPARDTVASLTGSIFFLLARHPKIWNKLREEVLSVGREKLTFELLKSMSYLQSVVNEALRLLSPVSRNFRTCFAPCILPHGGGRSGNDPILLESGDEVDMVLSAMHTDREIWGGDAEQFKPERWNGLKQSWDYIPFSGGRRICPAQQNVLTDVSYVLTRIIQEFKACENRDSCMDYVESRVFTPQSKNGIQVAFIVAE